MGERDELITYKLNSPEIQHLCEADDRLSCVIRRYGDLSYSLHADGFAFVVETIIGQMLSNKAADIITARLYALCGGELSLSTINTLKQSEIKSIGISNQKSAYIKGFSSFMQDSPDYFDELKELDDSEIIGHLTAVRGIGRWSAKMYLIFILNRLDVLPFEDGAFIQAYKWLYTTDEVKPSSVTMRCEPWKPYSSLAARYLYRALDYGLTRDSDLCSELNALPIIDIQQLREQQRD